MSSTIKRRIASGLTVLIALGIGYVGIGYLLAPAGMAPNFGLPAWPHGDGDGFLNLKGIRDLVSGLVPLALLATGQRRALGWALLLEALTPLGDAVIVLSHGGSAATAYGVHGLTAAVVLTTAALLLTERTTTAGEAAPAGAPGAGSHPTPGLRV
ncbi:DUF4267 domain-containing protein [Kitasatospora sp. NPDC050543]|uniref:DUF4267 domain-containing protein n=1 Tax=Kitasatospora sp. NPDC050543 TaxID=3364054 RepID=UPI00379491D7